MRIIVLTGLLLSGCATTPAAAPDVRTTHLVCDKTIPLDVNHDGRTAVVRNRDGQQVVLQRVVAPGARYEGSGITVMRTDDTYIYIARDGSTYGCDPLRP